MSYDTKRHGPMTVWQMKDGPCKGGLVTLPRKVCGFNADGNQYVPNGESNEFGIHYMRLADEGEDGFNADEQ